MSCLEFQSRDTQALVSFEFDGMQAKPSLVSTIIFQEVDSLGHKITSDSC